MVLAASVPSWSRSGSAPKRERQVTVSLSLPHLLPQAAPTHQAPGPPLRTTGVGGVTAEPKRNPSFTIPSKTHTCWKTQLQVSLLKSFFFFNREKCGRRIESLCLLCGLRKAAECVSLRNAFVALTVVKLALRCRRVIAFPQVSCWHPSPQCGGVSRS